MVSTSLTERPGRSLPDDERPGDLCLRWAGRARTTGLAPTRSVVLGCSSRLFLIAMSRSYLLVIGEVTALAWVLAEQRMAFSAQSRSQAKALEIGDELLIYTTRGCFHRPTRDRGRVMGIAAVESTTRDLSAPVVFGQRSYISGCNLSIHGLAPFREGVELAPIVPELRTFSVGRPWNMSLRRPLVFLDPRDADLLRRKVTPFLQQRDRYLDAYIQAARRRFPTSVIRENDA